MEHQPVVSSNLASVAYDRREGLLEVDFNSGYTYQYQGVPPGVVRGLLRAPSAGKYFHRNVRYSYQYERL